MSTTVDKPANKMVRMTTSWYIEWPMIFFIIVLEISGFVRPYGLRLSNSSLGNSVANASDARVSIIRFTQSICIAFSGESCQTKDKECIRDVASVSRPSSGSPRPRLERIFQRLSLASALYWNASVSVSAWPSGLNSSVSASCTFL